MERPMIADLNRLAELMDSTYVGSSYRVLREELKTLSRELEEGKKIDIENEEEAENDTLEYWTKKALRLEKSLEKSRESQVRLVESLKTMKISEGYSSFILKSAPFVMGHQDQDLRYKFIINQFPSLKEEDILGKTDTEIFHGSGIKELEEFKREVLEKGRAAKREITLETDLFGLKTFLMYVEPVYNKNGEKIGINYISMEVTDQIRKREKLAKLREENAKRKEMASELTKTILITEEKRETKKMLAKMSSEIRSPLLEIASMAQKFCTTTNVNEEQRQLLNDMISSTDLALELMNKLRFLTPLKSSQMKSNIHC